MRRKINTDVNGRKIAMGSSSEEIATKAIIAIVEIVTICMPSLCSLIIVYPRLRELNRREVR
jgi:hypothetical protein